MAICCHCHLLQVCGMYRDWMEIGFWLHVYIYTHIPAENRIHGICTFTYIYCRCPLMQVCVYICIYRSVFYLQTFTSVDTHVHVHTGWWRPTGCLKLQVIFCKRATNYRALLRKKTCKNNSSYGSSPPCTLIRADRVGFRERERVHVRACLDVRESVRVCVCERVCVSFGLFSCL